MKHLVWPGAIALLAISLSAGAAIEPGPGGEAAAALYHDGQYDAAETAFLSLEKNTESASAAYFLGKIQEQRGDLEAAVDWMEQAAERDPKQSIYQQELGEYYGTLIQEASVFGKMSLAKKTRHAFEQAVALDGGNLDARSGLITYYLQAPSIAGGSPEKAMEQAQAIARQDPVRGHFALARVYQVQEDFEAAENEYRAALAIDAETRNHWLALGQFLTARERYDEALGVYSERLSLVPDDYLTMYQLGRTVSISGEQLEQGRVAFARYIAEFEPAAGDPGHDWAHYRLGLIYERLSDPAAARSEYREALALNPDHPEAKGALRQLD